MKKIHLGIDKNISIFKQIPLVEFNLLGVWKEEWGKTEAISHGDIIKYQDGTSDVFKEGLDNGFAFVFFTFKASNDISWNIELSWLTEYIEDENGEYDGEYELCVTKDDPAIEDSSSLPWIRVKSQDKHFLVDLINQIMRLIYENDINGLEDFRKKYHFPFEDIDEEEYWKNPAAWWEKKCAEDDDQDQKEG